jgi:hypothetical protein
MGMPGIASFAEAIISENQTSQLYQAAELAPSLQLASATW